MEKLKFISSWEFHAYLADETEEKFHIYMLPVSDERLDGFT